MSLDPTAPFNQDQRRLELHASFSPWKRVFEFLMWTQVRPGETAVGVATAITLKTLTEEQSGEPLEALFTLDPKAAQMLFDDLWRAGLRPGVGGSTAEGELIATRNHLGDMRRYADRLLDVALAPAILPEAGPTTLRFSESDLREIADRLAQQIVIGPRGA